MLISPTPAGQKLPRSNLLGSLMPVQTASDIHRPAEQSELWEASSSKEEGVKKRQPCSFFLKTGNCAFGAECKFEHPLDQPATQYNSLGLPLRPGEPDCAYYVKNLHCGYGGSCKFHHAEPVIGWMPVMSENMGMHPSMMGYGQLGGLPQPGLPGSYPLHMPMMPQAAPQLPLHHQAGSLPSQQQYAAQMRPYMHMSMPMLMPSQQYMQMRMPTSPQMVHQPQHSLTTGPNPLLFQGMPQRAPRRESRAGDAAQALASDSSGSSRPAEAGRSRRKGRGRGVSHTASPHIASGSERAPALGRPAEERMHSLSSSHGDMTTSAFAAMSLEGRREGQ